jgi:hypothetical protein
MESQQMSFSNKQQVYPAKYSNLQAFYSIAYLRSQGWSRRRIIKEMHTRLDGGGIISIKKN